VDHPSLKDAKGSDPPQSRAGSTTLVVEPSEAGVRLDSFLARHKLVPSTAAAKRAVASGVVRVNGKRAKKGAHLEPGDVVDLGEKASDKVAWAPAPGLVLTVLYADDNIVAVNKPTGLATHPLRAHDAPTLAHALIARFSECAHASPDGREAGLAHRLDVATSGVLLAARQRETWYRLRQALASPTCEKIYLAEVQGTFPRPDTLRAEYVMSGPRPSSFVVTAPVGRQGRHGSKVKLASGRNPLPARTEVTWLETRPGGALVEARLCRGRAHQVRAHLAHLGIPVLGDTLYGHADSPADSPTTAALHLHAWTVSLVHPVTGKPLRIEAPPPAWAERRETR